MNQQADEKRPDRDKDFKIIVNGRQRTVEGELISFEQVVRLAFPESKPNAVYTVTYSDGPKENREGCMSAGDKVHVKNNMVFNVTETDKS
jgi:hypothetical protein